MFKSTTNSPARTFFLYRIVNNLLLFGLLTSLLSSCAVSTDAEKKPFVAAKKIKPVISKKELSKQFKEEISTKTIKPDIKINKLIDKGSHGDTKKRKLIINEIKESLDELATINFDLSNLSNRLVGMNGEAIKAILGFPAFKRSEPPARIWQYRTQVCIANVFLYKNGKELTTKYVGFRGRDTEQVDDEACFKSIVIMNPGNKKVG